MRIAKGPRPWSIRLFALAFLLVAFLGLANGLIDWSFELPRWQSRIGWIEWTYESVVVAEFTEFTIALIPIVWIYVFAAARARWIVLVFSLLKLSMLWWAISNAFGGAGLPAPAAVLEAILIVAALVLLFLPVSVRWLNGEPAGGDEAS